jgi:hypothetical protein
MTNLSKYILIPESKLLLCRYHGETYLEDIIKLTRLYISDKAFDASFSAIIDFRSSHLIGFGTEVYDFIDFIRNNYTLQTVFRNGILVNTEKQENLMNIYKPLASEIKLEIEVFRDLNDCVNWLKIPEEKHSFIARTLSNMV